MVWRSTKTEDGTLNFFLSLIFLSRVGGDLNTERRDRPARVIFFFLSHSGAREQEGWMDGEQKDEMIPKVREALAVTGQALKAQSGQPEPKSPN